MNVTSQQTEKLLNENHRFSQLGFSMMITRLKGLYTKDPSLATLKNSMNEINSFLDKFNSIMANDYAIIAKL